MFVKTDRKNVLIVEDDGIQQIIMKRFADRLGLNVLAIVSKGFEAVETARSLPEIDLIMMDVRLADNIDGIEAMTRIRKSANSIKVIYVTGNSEPETRNRALETNYDAFLEKPVTEEKLRFAVSKAFAEV
ncbi:response regulator [Rhodohalobacter sp. SW132]|uniref:response regulator n=1 Tax=Rhodohalobacter sp. SW132 TaxID=2293433 RepID=UPI000E287752|nr:response regulator [Rhodohalobacter sp. SW132]REL38217.1 response regulator [Rhodohalobacter sp. SW132]